MIFKFDNEAVMTMNIDILNFKLSAKLLSFAAVLTVLQACSPAPAEQTKVQKPQAVKLIPATSNSQIVERTFPAEVSAVKTIDLSFEVSGRLIQTQLKTGTIASQSQMLAQIDPTPFKQRVQEAQAKLNQATRDLERITATAKKGSASQSQLDNAKTNFELANIALKRAQKDLSYTRLLSPFDAQISERFAEKGNYVQAGDIVARLQDVSRYYFNVNVPERLVSRYKEGSLIGATAHIISAPERIYQLEYVEHATQPDPITQTYKVVFAASAKNTDLTPGARAVVAINLNNQTTKNQLLVPFNALQGNDSEGFHVWKFNKASSTVSRVNVDVVAVQQQVAAVDSDIVLGDLIVSAGASQMREGLIVKPYQAEL